MAPELTSAEENLRKMGEFIETICSTQPTDLIVFPELSYTGTELGLRATTLAERVPGHATNYLAKRAEDYNTHIVFGLVIKERVESILFNGVACLGPDGELISAYHKVHLLGEERQVYRSGFRFINVDADWGRFGLMIGSDLVFPEAARSLTLDGAELLVLAANWESGKREQWRAQIVSRATENAVFVAAANRVGEEPTIQFAGDSMLAGPDGELYTVLEEPMEGYAVATIDLERVRAIREESQLIQFREPNAYRAIVRKY
jgi:predicted amidohydrolase